MGEGTTARRAGVALGALLMAGCGDAVARVVALGPSSDAAVEGGADAGHPTDAGGGDAPMNGSDAADSAQDAQPVDAAVDAPGCVAEVEPNGMPAQAQHIIKGTTCGMIRSFGDVDYYEFDFATSGTNFTFGFDGDSSLQLLITAPGAGGVDMLTPPAMVGQTSAVGMYQVMIWDTQAVLPGYVLTLDY